MALGRIFIGVGGWTFEPWRGTYYPEKLTQKRELETRKNPGLSSGFMIHLV